MRPSRFDDTQIRQALNDVTSGTPLVAVCRKLGITQTTFYRWRRKFDDIAPPVGREATELRDENQRLKQLVADLYLAVKFPRDVRVRGAKPPKARA